MLEALARAVLTPFDPGLRWRGQAPESPSLALTSLGTAGFTLASQGRTVVIDPYVSRPTLWRALTRPLVPDADAVARSVPRADDVLVGHAHFDHVLDAPEVCRQTGARLIGSQAVAYCGIAAGLPASQIRVTEGDEDIESGPLMLRGLPSVHGRVYFNRIPLPGDLTAPPPWPPRLRDLPHGRVLNWLVRTPTHTLVHIDSADFIDDALASQRADILCLCAVGRHARPDYTQRAIELLRPQFVVPCHWDHFFGPFTPTPLEVPKADLAGFVREISAAGATPVVLTPGDTFSV